jgi:hypothetical protein
MPRSFERNVNFNQVSEKVVSSAEALERTIQLLERVQIEQREIIQLQQDTLKDKVKALDYWEQGVEARRDADTSKDRTIWELKQRVQNLVSSITGEKSFSWILRDLPTWDECPERESPVFQSASDSNGHCYALKLKLYPRGVKVEKNEEPRHAAIGWKVVDGDDDDFLAWPAKLRVIVRVPLPTPNSGEAKTFVIDTGAESGHSTYRRPGGLVPTEKKAWRIFDMWICLGSIDACITRRGEMRIIVSAYPYPN